MLDPHRLRGKPPLPRRLGSRRIFVLLLLLGAVSLAALVRRSMEPDRFYAKPPTPDDLAPENPTDGGRWFHVSPGTPPKKVNENLTETIRALEAIGYVNGSEPSRGLQGVTRIDPDRVEPGYNFFTSGLGGMAVLADLNGEVLHEWKMDFRTVWPDRRIPRDKNYWRRAYLYPNGDVVGIYEGHGIVRVDRSSNLLWSNPVQAHHDLERASNGELWVLTRKARVIPRIDSEYPVLEDFISVLDERDGTEKRRISLLSCFESSRFRQVLDSRTQKTGDIFHTNTLEILSRSHHSNVPWMKEGNVLLSMLALDCVAVVDPSRQTVVMAVTGEFKRQHDPKILDSGNLLLFDNQGVPGSSRVSEFDPGSWELLWQYRGTSDDPFFTATCGAAQRLPNGNTLITESDSGRAFEVTTEGQTVWEYHSPHRVGENGEFVAALLEVLRIPEEEVRSWLPR